MSAYSSSPFAGRGLTLVHGHRHTWEYATQAKVFRQSAEHWLVTNSDLLLAANSNGSEAMHVTLSRHLAHYPHTGKAVALPSNRGGFRCGLLDAIEDLHPTWREASFVISVHPDVFLLPKAVQAIGELMHEHRDTAFFVTRFMDSARAFDVDLIVFRPPLLGGVNPFKGMCSCTPPCGKPRGQPQATPEAALARFLRSSSLKRIEMCSRHSSDRQVDPLGVWHTHSRAQLEQYLSSPQAAAAYQKRPMQGKVCERFVGHSDRTRPLFRRNGVIATFNMSCAGWKCTKPKHLRGYEDAFEDELWRTLPPAVKCPAAQLIVPSDTPLPPTNMLVQSAAALGVSLAVPFLTQGAQGLRRRVYNQTLSAMGSCPDTAILLVDAFDTFVRCSPAELQRRIRAFGPGSVIVSAERNFTFQNKLERPLWDELASNRSTSSPYRFVNGGGIGGFHVPLAAYARVAAAEAPPPFGMHFRLRSGQSDQNPTARLVMRDAMPPSDHQSLGLQLDYESSLFHTCTGEDWNITSALKRIKKADPCIVHMPDGHFRQVLRELYDRAAPRPRPLD